jgi:N-acetylglucosaminyldiphosphoundecaprenol N-acetyl-beta-D-mannosaminyltransferase
MLRRQVRIGRVHVDVLDRESALAAIARLVEDRAGGYVFTPNVDHVVLAEDLEDLAAAYARARLSLADGVPILWASRLLGQPLPAKLSGSDMVLPIAGLAASAGWSVYLLGGRPGSGERAAEALCDTYPRLKIAGIDAPMMSLSPGHAGTREAFDRVRRARPDILLVGLGAPKQELLLHRAADLLGPTLGFGVGASIDFLAGEVPRAPRWMSEVGLEWFYRLYREPKRMWRRYLLRDPRFVSIVWRTLREPREGRFRALPLLPARAEVG